MIVDVADGPDIVAVLPSLGVDTQRLLDCLSSVRASTFDGRLAVVVVWNDWRLPLPELGDVTVLRPGINLGFPGALNHVRSRITARYVWILQDDLTVEPGCLQSLLGRISAQDQPAMVSPVLLTEDGLIRPHCRGGVFESDGRLAYPVPREATPPAQLDLTGPLDFVASSGALARLSAWDEVGGYDPDFYPLLWSDADFCGRLLRAGHRIALEPSAIVDHVINGSTPGLLHGFLATTNLERFRAKHVLSSPEPIPDFDLDPVLAHRIAARASLVLIDFARYGSAELRSAQRNTAERDARWVEGIEARDRMITELTRQASQSAGHAERQKNRIAALDRRLAKRAARTVAQDRRIGKLERELATLRSSRSWRLIAALRAIRARSGRRRR